MTKPETRTMPKVGDKIKRSLSISSKMIDEAERTVEIAFASEEPYERWWGVEITDLASMDMERLNSGAALLFNHDWDAQIGVVEAARVDDDLIARAKVRFSKSPLGQEKMQDVIDGILTKVSYGYEITEMQLEKEVEGVCTYRVNVSPFELSFVTVPADNTVGLGKSHDDENVVSVSTVNETDNINDHVEVSEMEQTNETVETPKIDIAEVEKAAAEKALKAQKSYEREVKEICKLAGFEKEAEGFINENLKLEFVREKLMEKKAEAEKEIATFARIESGEDNAAKRKEERSKQLASLMNPAIEGSKDYKFGSIHQLAKTLMAEKGVDTTLLTGNDIAKMILSKDHATSDFPLITADAVNKTLLRSYDDMLAVQTWRPLVDETSVADYKAISNVRSGESPDLEKLPEGAAPEYGTLSEQGDSYVVEDYAKGLALTKKLIINDDLRAFSREVSRFGSSAARKESEIFWQVFQSGQVFGDDLYTVARGNLETGTDLDIAGLSKLRANMRKMKPIDSQDPLNIMGAYLVVSDDLETQAEQILNQTMIADQVANVNPFAGKLQLIVDSRLANGAWYVTADKAMVDLFEIAYLNGRRAPQVDQMIDFDTKSLKIRCEHSFGIKALDYRGLQKAEA